MPEAAIMQPHAAQAPCKQKATKVNTVTTHTHTHLSNRRKAAAQPAPQQQHCHDRGKGPPGAPFPEAAEAA